MFILRGAPLAYTEPKPTSNMFFSVYCFNVVPAKAVTQDFLNAPSQPQNFLKNSNLASPVSIHVLGLVTM
jgi:hypothetical protein